MQTLRVGLVQMAPIWLNRTQTEEKICEFLNQAGQQNCRLVAFGEGLLPGYPFWLDWTGGSKFNDPIQKELFAHYADQAVVIERGDLDRICQLAKHHQFMIVLGTIERATDRGGHSLYCSLVKISPAGVILSIHRKLMPTYEERLVWSPGDGHGLRVDRLDDFTVGALNCWENWMPLARASLYAQGEDLHVAAWPGAVRNTINITRFIAQESRSYVLSVSGLLDTPSIPSTTPQFDLLREQCPGEVANGGSCIAGPDGEWVCEPLASQEQLIVADLDHSLVRGERQNFDPSGHYSRPDVTQLTVNRTRQSVARFEET